MTKLTATDLEAILTGYDYYLNEYHSVMGEIENRGNEQIILNIVAQYLEQFEGFLDRTSQKLDAGFRQTASNLKKMETIKKYYGLMEDRRKKILKFCPENVRMALAAMYLT